MTNTYPVVAHTHNADIVPLEQPYTPDHLQVGQIVACDSQYFRIYDGGRSGLRFWCVTDKFKQAQIEFGHVEDDSDYELTIFDASIYAQ